jgi:hypothetical protein
VRLGEAEREGFDAVVRLGEAEREGFDAVESTYAKPRK